MFLSHINVSLPFFLPPFLSLKINKLLKKKEEKEEEGGLNKQRDIACIWMGRFSVYIKMCISPNPIRNFENSYQTKTAKCVLRPRTFPCPSAPVQCRWRQIPMEYNGNPKNRHSRRLCVLI